MKFGFQILTTRSLPMREGDYFATEIWVNGKPIESASGRDTYQLNTIILPQKKLAGTGRTHTYTQGDLICGMGHVQARPLAYVDLPSEVKTISLKLENSRLLDYRELPLILEVEVHWQNQSREYSQRISLQRPGMKIDWSERGSFMIDFTTVYQQLMTQIA